MNAKMKATFAVAIVAMMVFAAAGATTYSWFSDTEETDITVSTAEVNIVGGFTEVSVGESSDTTAGINGGDLSINNVVADRTVNAIYTVTNYSTIDTQYRAYIVVSGLDDNQMDQVSVKVGGNKVVFTDGIGYFVGGAEIGEALIAATSENGNKIDYEFIITTSDAIGNSFPGFSMKVVVEAYQYGYNYSAPMDFNEGSATFGDIGNNANVKVEGKTKAEAGAPSVPVVFEFDLAANAAEKMSDAVLTVTSLSTMTSTDAIMLGDDSNSVILDIDLKKGGDDVTEFGSVIIAVPIFGKVAEPVVLCNDGTSPEKMFVTNVEYVGNDTDGWTTYVSFKTTRLSEYIIGEFAASIDGTYFATLEDAISEANNADVSGSIIINLYSGEFETNFDIEGGRDITIIGSETGNSTLYGQIATTTSDKGKLTLKNLNFFVDGRIQDSTGISQTGKSAIAIWGNQTVMCEDVKFTMSLSDSTAITSWWDTGVGTSIVVKDCVFDCNGQRPIRATGNVTIDGCIFNDPYRYALQLTAKTSTATLLEKAIVNFTNNTIINGENGKPFVYGVQLEGSDYGCNDLLINGSGNKIENGGADSTMYYCECGKVNHATVEFNVDDGAPVHENPNDVLSDCLEAGVAVINLPAGEYKFPEIKDKEYKIVGSGKETVVLCNDMGEGYQTVSGSTLSFENLTVKFGIANYKGFQHINSLTYKDCYIDGLQLLYADTDFENCVFTTTGEHNVWTYGAKNVKFKDCTFNYKDRSINCYADSDPTEQNVTFENCDFVYAGDNENPPGAIEINSSEFSIGITVKVNECSVNKGDLYFIPKWDSLGGLKTIVVKDGETVFGEGQVIVSEEAIAQTPNILSKVLSEGASDIVFSDGEFSIDLCNIDDRDELTISGQGAETKLEFLESNVTLYDYGKLTIDNCEIMKMPNKWGHITFGSSAVGGGIYTISNCIFNGVGTQGIYINQNVPATFNIENCIFNGDFGGEGAITIQNNPDVNITITVTGCEFNYIPVGSHEIFVHYAYNGFTLNAEGIEQYWKANQTSQ